MKLELGLVLGKMMLWSSQKHGCERNMNGSSKFWGFDVSNVMEREGKEVEELLF